MFVLGYYFLLCPNRSVCILIKSEKFSFSKMLRKELYLRTFAQKLYYGWMSTMTSSNESSWKFPPSEMKSGLRPCFMLLDLQFQVTLQQNRKCGGRSFLMEWALFFLCIKYICILPFESAFGCFQDVVYFSCILLFSVLFGVFKRWFGLFLLMTTWQTCFCVVWASCCQCCRYVVTEKY